MYIYLSVMCRLSRMVQESYCSVQNVQDKRALNKDDLSRNFVLGEPQASLEQNCTNLKASFSGGIMARH